MRATTYTVAAMDCGAEEQMIRMGLAGLNGIADIRTDTFTRTVVVIHDTDTELVDAAIDGLGLRSHRTSHHERRSRQFA